MPGHLSTCSDNTQTHGHELPSTLMETRGAPRLAQGLGGREVTDAGEQEKVLAGAPVECHCHLWSVIITYGDDTITCGLTPAPEERALSPVE